MSTKDYYRILDVKPTAGPEEIRKAFRALALRFHPDKNAGNPLAEMRFKEIREAYEILGDKVKRDAWHHRHYNIQHKGPALTPNNPDDILLQSIQIHKSVSGQDPFRLNHDGLFLKLQQLLNPYNVALVQQADEIHTNSAIVNNILQSTELLPWMYAQQICALLLTITPVLPQTTEDIEACLLAKKREWLWNKYKIPVAVLLAGLLILIMVISR